jgi:hypothetical protein
VESRAKSRQAPHQSVHGRQITFKYEASSVQIDLEGDIVPHNGLRGANKESRAAYFKARPFSVHLFKRGHKIWFNPATDILHFSNLSSVFSHHLRQRQRVPLPFLKGLHNAKKIAFDHANPDDETIQNLADDVMDLYRINVLKINMAWITDGKSYKFDTAWTRAVMGEENKLDGEMKNTRTYKALGRVNGGHINANARILHLPLKAEDLA